MYVLSSLNIYVYVYLFVYKFTIRFEESTHRRRFCSIQRFHPIRRGNVIRQFGTMYNISAARPTRRAARIRSMPCVAQIELSRRIEVSRRS